MICRELESRPKTMAEKSRLLLPAHQDNRTFSDQSQRDPSDNLRKTESLPEPHLWQPTRGKPRSGSTWRRMMAEVTMQVVWSAPLRRRLEAAVGLRTQDPLFGTHLFVCAKMGYNTKAQTMSINRPLGSFKGSPTCRNYTLPLGIDI